MTRSLSLLILAGLAAAVGPVVGPVMGDEKKDVRHALEGTYTIVSGEEDGKPIPNERLEGSVVTFKGDRVVLVDKDKNELYAATFRIDTATRPWKVRMTSTVPRNGEQAAGVIEQEGDTVRLCYALPGGMAPTEFKAGEKQQCFVIKRMTK